jgi:hypothetical protein
LCPFAAKRTCIARFGWQSANGWRRRRCGEPLRSSGRRVGNLGSAAVGGRRAATTALFNRFLCG